MIRPGRLQFGHRLQNFPAGPAVCLLQRFFFGGMGEDHHLHHVAQVIENNQMPAGRKNGFGHSPLFRDDAGQMFPASDQVIINIAHQPSLKRREIDGGHGLEAGHYIPDYLQRIFDLPKNRALPALPQLDGPVACRHLDKGPAADKTVAPPVFAAVGAFQQVGIRFVSQFQIGGDRCFRISQELPVDGYQVSLSCHLPKF